MKSYQTTTSCALTLISCKLKVVIVKTSREVHSTLVFRDLVNPDFSLSGQRVQRADK